MSDYPRLVGLRAAGQTPGMIGIRAYARYRAALDALPGALDPAVPLALLPVRLETRIRARTDILPGDELLCRIYPDDIHTDAHEPGLTDAETVAGQHYWAQWWDAAGRPNAEPPRAAAWAQLAALLTPPRAAWVARSMTPLNLPPTAGAAPAFPTPPAATAGRPSSAAALPDRWIVRLWRDGVRIGEGRGELVPRPLAMGPPPAVGDPAAPAAWLVDISAALAVGMAVLVRPDPPVVLDRIDVVTATGVRGTDDATESGAALRDLFDAHQFALGLTGPGLDLLAAGTPTNNTPAVRTQRRRDGTGTTARDSWLGPAVAARGDGSDAAALAAALGLPDRDSADPAGEPFTLGRLPGASAAGQRDAAAMATLLWPATWGYYLRQFAPGIAGLGRAPDLTAWRRFVIDTVRGRGPLPTLRVRDQPYGVLPALDTPAWQPWPAQPELITGTLTQRRGRPPIAAASLRTGWDLEAAGGWTGGWTGSGAIPVEPGSDALDLGTLVPADGRAVLVALTTVAGAAAPAYQLSAPIGVDGRVTGWTANVPVPRDPDGVFRSGGCGVAVAPIGGRASLVVAVTRSPNRSAATETTVRVGTGLDPSGAVQDWSAPVPVPDTLDAGRLVGIAAADLTGDGRETDLVLAWVRAGRLGDEIMFRVGRDLQPAGDAGRWSAERRAAVPAGWSLAGAGIAVATFGGAPALVVHLTSQPSGAGGQQIAAYLVGHELAADGAVGHWDGPFNTGDLPPAGGTVRAAPVVVAAIDRQHDVSMSRPAGLVELLARIRSSWAAAVPQVPRIGRAAPPAAPTDDLLDLFARDAVSGRVRGRGLLGGQLLANTWLAAGRTPDGPRYIRELWQVTRGQLFDWGLIDPGDPAVDDPARKPRLGLAAYETVATDVDLPLAVDGTAARLAWAAKALPADLHTATDPRMALLDRLARHASLQAWADAGLLLRPPGSPVESPPTTEPELVDLADLTAADPVVPPETPTAWRHLSRQTFPAGSPFAGRPVWEGVAELLKTVESGGDVASYGPAGQAVVELAELRAALRRLASLAPADLARLLGETLDVASHRLDAWVTALATDRLRAMRAARPDGVQLGGWGVVVDLHAAPVTGAEGFLHAPSVSQAATAAVLRSGYLSHAGDAAGGTLALDLGSRRVRAATELSAGVSSGQPLGALLGYRFERAVLADPARGLGRYLPALRQVAPLYAGKREPLPAGTAVDAVAADAVVDGLGLIRAAAGDAADPIPWGRTPDGADDPLPALTDPDGVALAALVDDLRDAVDALGDLLVADSVHHVVGGSAAAGGGSLDVLAGGEVPPPQPAVMRTPRTGVAVSFRLLLALPERATVPHLATWSGKAPRALAEPRLDAWAATVLGSPANVRWRASWPEAGPAVGAEFPLSALGFCPLDVLALATGDPPRTETKVDDPAARTELARMLARHAAANPPAGAAGLLRLRFDADPAWPAGTLTVPELTELAAAAADLVGGARAATAADMAGPRGLPPDPAVDLTEVTAAATVAADGLADAVDAIRTGDAAAGLAALSRYGIPHSAPGEPDALDGQVVNAGAEADRRLSEAAKRLADADPVAALRAVFGEGFTVVPPFTLAPGELAAGLAARTTAGDAPDPVVGDWLEDVAAVRAGAARLADVLLLANARPPLQVAQFPASVQHWAALPSPDGSTPPAGTVSVVLAGALAKPAAKLAALLVDDWIEIVPGTVQDTSVLFQLDAPTATAPQSVLLALPADPTRPWTADRIERVVLETLALAKERAVDADLPGAPPAGHFLPALLFARNTGGDPDGDTISTDFPRTPAP